MSIECLVNCFSIPFTFLRSLFVSLSLSVLLIAQIRGQALLPPHNYGSCVAFYRERTSALSPLANSLRIVPTCSRRSQQSTPYKLLLNFGK